MAGPDLNRNVSDSTSAADASRLRQRARAWVQWLVSMRTFFTPNNPNGPPCCRFNSAAAPLKGALHSTCRAIYVRREPADARKRYYTGHFGRWDGASAGQPDP